MVVAEGTEAPTDWAWWGTGEESSRDSVAEYGTSSKVSNALTLHVMYYSVLRKLSFRSFLLLVVGFPIF